MVYCRNLWFSGTAEPGPDLLLDLLSPGLNWDHSVLKLCAAHWVITNAVPSFTPAPMAPRGRGTNAQGCHGQPSTLLQQQQQQQVQVPATTSTEPKNDAIALDPVTPIHHTGPFPPSLHNLQPIPAWPSSPDEEDFDFDEADAIPITPPPAAGALGSPVKRAYAVGGNQVSLHWKGDLQVWDENDEDIISVCFYNWYTNIMEIDAARKIWQSNVYDHYVTTVNCICDPFSSQPERIEFIFTCRTHPENHQQPLHHDWSKTGDGTTKFLKDIQMCEEKQGIYQPQPAPKAVPYTPETHHAVCALIALHCAKHSHPINSIFDDNYHIEVEMLRPGTVLPHPTTVRCDLIDIYIHMSTFVMNYFMVIFFFYCICKS